MMSTFLFPFYVTDCLSYTDNNIKADKKNTTHNRTPHWIPVWKSTHRQLQHCMISGYHCGIKENHPSEVNRKSDKKKKMELDWTHIM